LASRFFFRGIYFPQKGVLGWLRLIAQNRGPLYSVVKDCFTQWHGTRRSPEPVFLPKTQPEPGSN
jgi:hypothetical protein